MSAKSAKSPRQAVLVLGMHRSGTSALAGTLSILGCDLPASQMKADEHNSKGYFESSQLYLLHDRLLASAGSSWDDWLSVNPGWFESARAEEYRERAAATLQEEFGKSRLFVLKDPRICRLLPFWLDILPNEGCTPLVVHTHRHPLEVARSLERRDGIGIDLGMLLWMRHILDAERDSRGTTRVFTSYQRLMNNWAETAQGIQDSLGVKLPRMARTVATEIDAFLAPDLKHFTDTPDKVLRSPLISEWIRNLYRILEDWAESGEKEEDHETIDQIRSEFDAAAPAFHRLVELGQQTSRSLREATSELADIGAKNSSLQARLAESENAGKTLEQKLSDARTESNERQSEIARLKEENSGLQGQSEERGKSVEALKRQLSDAQAENERRKEDLEAKLAEADGKLAESDKAREELRQHVAELEAKIEKRAAKISRLEEASEEQGALVDTLTRKLDEADAERTASSELAHRFESQLEETQSELSALKDELAVTKSHLEQRTHEADETARDLATAQSQVTEKARKIEVMSTEIRRYEHDLAAQNDTVRQHAADLANISTLLAEREANLETSHAEITELKESLKTLTEQLSEERLAHAAASARGAEQVRELEHSVELQVRELTQIAQILLDTETRLEKAQDKSTKESEEFRQTKAVLDEKLKEVTEKAEKAEKRVKALETSTSWKITAPIRKIRRAFKRGN